MKEIKNTTIYTKEKVKEFLKIYYFEKIKVPRIIINILIILSLNVILFLSIHSSIGHFLTKISK